MEPIRQTKTVEVTDNIPVTSLDSNVVQDNILASKINKTVVFIFGFIEILILIRLFLLLLGARINGFVSFVYNLTEVFIMPFRGIFPSPAVEGAYFDTAALIALIVLGLICWGITVLVDILVKPQ